MRGIDFWGKVNLGNKNRKACLTNTLQNKNIKNALMFFK